jgi:hypothetical protein
MEGLTVAIQSRALSLVNPVLRAELENFGYEYTKTGVRYAGPPGLHDDTVCALALAVQARAQFTPVEVVTVRRQVPTLNPADIRAQATVTFNDMRQDPEWGWERY